MIMQCIILEKVNRKNIVTSFKQTLILHRRMSGDAIIHVLIAEYTIDRYGLF